MAYYKPQSPIKNGEDYIYPLTTHDQIIMADGSRWNGKMSEDFFVANNITTTEEGYVLDARQGYALNTLISQKATTARYSATLPTSGWSDSAPYAQTVSVSGVLTTDDPIADIDMSSASTSTQGTALLDAWNLIGRIKVNDGSITVYCYEEKPEVDMTISLKVVR